LAAAEGTEQVETWFSKDKKAKVFAAPDPTEAASLLEVLCCLYQLAQCLPLPFWPEAYDRMRQLEDNARKNGASAIEPETLLTAAWTTWTEGPALALRGRPSAHCRQLASVSAPRRPIHLGAEACRSMAASI